MSQNTAERYGKGSGKDYADHVCKEHAAFIRHKRQEHTENDKQQHYGDHFPSGMPTRIKSSVLPSSFPYYVIALFISVAILIL